MLNWDIIFQWKFYFPNHGWVTFTDTSSDTESWLSSLAVVSVPPKSAACHGCSWRPHVPLGCPQTPVLPLLEASWQEKDKLSCHAAGAPHCTFSVCRAHPLLPSHVSAPKPARFGDGGVGHSVALPPYERAHWIKPSKDHVWGQGIHPSCVLLFH